MGETFTSRISQLLLGGDLLRAAGRRLLDQILPPRCLACGAGALDAGRLCADCWKGLTFLQGAACACCGTPLPHDPGAGESQNCAACHASPPPFARARAALRYDDGCRRMILGYKHGDRTDYAPFFARLLVQASRALVAADPLVTPVPLHRNRLRRRRYNQAALMGQAFAAARGYSYIPDLLVRTRNTLPQAGNYGRRRRNVAGAFAFNARHQATLQGRHVILIDDVYTTGATARACARHLTQQGAAGVEVLTLARV